MALKLTAFRSFLYLLTSLPPYFLFHTHFQALHPAECHIEAANRFGTNSYQRGHQSSTAANLNGPRWGFTEEARTGPESKSAAKLHCLPVRVGLQRIADQALGMGMKAEIDGGRPL